MKKILFAASESVPFIKTGGLADVVGSLPKYFDKEKYDVRVMLPKYMCMKDEWKEKLQYHTHFYMDLNWRKQYVGVLEMEYDGIKFYFIDNEYYFGRDGLYGYPDDGERYAFFCKAVLESLQHIGFTPDVIHANDWQTGYIPLFLNEFYRGLPGFDKIKTVFTIHNIEYQGKADPDFISNVLGVSDSRSGDIMFDGLANAMKCAIMLSDYHSIRNIFARNPICVFCPRSS